MKSAFATLTAAWLALVAASPAQNQFEDIWRQYGPVLMNEGISKPVAKQAFLWTEFQYHLGICRRYIAEPDIDFWRLWWKNSKASEGSFGAQILKSGNKSFNKGSADLATSPLSQGTCQTLVKDWFVDMRQAAEEGGLPIENRP